MVQMLMNALKDEEGTQGKKRERRGETVGMMLDRKFGIRNWGYQRK